MFAQTEFGTASYYGIDFHGKPTASGQIYSQNKLTAAHKTLPLGTLVKVTNTKNNKSVYVRINDRGPFVKGRVIDLSTKAAELLGYRNSGTAHVKIEVVNPNGFTPDQLTASTIARQNGIEKCDSSPSTSVMFNSAWKEIPTVLDDENEPDNIASAITEAKKSEGEVETNPQDNMPQPATEIRESNTNGIINRSPYFVITNIDKSQAGFYAVQVGVFSDPSVIFSLMDELEKFKQSLMIQQVQDNGKSIYKLYMGKFQNRAYADALQSILSDKYKDAVVMKY
jgi:rare lipoprotein A